VHSRGPDESERAVYTRLIFVWGKSMALARIDLRAFKRL
jgi:hypothetical protein